MLTWGLWLCKAPRQFNCKRHYTNKTELNLYNHLPQRTALSPTQICTMMDLCLSTTYFQYRENFDRHKNGPAIVSPVVRSVLPTLVKKTHEPSLEFLALRKGERQRRLDLSKWKKTEVEEFRFTGNRHTPTSTSILIYTTHWNNLGVIKTQQHRAKEIPTKTRGKRRNRNTAKQH